MHGIGTGFAIILALLYFATAQAQPGYPDHPGSFRAAKKMAEPIHRDHTSFYCGCSYQRKAVDRKGCGYKPRKQPKRGARIEWEHVVSAWEIGHQRQCWQNGGRRNCRKSDPRFVMMSADLHNLVPAVGELNGDRSNFRFGMLQGERRAYGQCDFEVDFKLRRAEPPDRRFGDVARIYFYMRDRYGLAISSSQRQLFEAWSRMDPVDAQERERDRRITEAQGNSNCYVSGDCRIVPVRQLPAPPK